MDSTTKALIETIGDAGYHVLIGAAEGSPVVEAVCQRAGEPRLNCVVRGLTRCWTRSVGETLVKLSPENHRSASVMPP